MNWGQKAVLGLFISAASMLGGRDAQAQAKAPKAKNDTTINVSNGSKLTLPKDMLAPGYQITSVTTGIESGRQVYWLTQIVPNPQDELKPKQRVEIVAHGTKGRVTWNDLESLTVFGKNRQDQIMYIDEVAPLITSFGKGVPTQTEGAAAKALDKKIKAEIFKIK